MRKIDASPKTGKVSRGNDGETVKLCIACGMPMERGEDYPLGDETKNYCVHCARPDGSMQSYEEKVASLAAFVVRTQGLDPKAARSVAIGMMRRLPAWSDKK